MIADRISVASNRGSRQSCWRWSGSLPLVDLHVPGQPAPVFATAIEEVNHAGRAQACGTCRRAQAKLLAICKSWEIADPEIGYTIAHQASGNQQSRIPIAAFFMVDACPIDRRRCRRTAFHFETEDPGVGAEANTLAPTSRGSGQSSSDGSRHVKSYATISPAAQAHRHYEATLRRNAARPKSLPASGDAIHFLTLVRNRAVSGRPSPLW